MLILNHCLRSELSVSEGKTLFRRNLLHHQNENLLSPRVQERLGKEFTLFAKLVMKKGKTWRNKSSSTATPGLFSCGSSPHSSARSMGQPHHIRLPPKLPVSDHTYHLRSSPESKAWHSWLMITWPQSLLQPPFPPERGSAAVTRHAGLRVSLTWLTSGLSCLIDVQCLMVSYEGSLRLTGEKQQRKNRNTPCKMYPV